MILFANDWRNYNSAIIHTKTRNKSWLRLAAVYKAMGIKNHAFHLALHNPALEEVDPFDPNLTIETMADIAYECKTNPWYYLRECAMVPGQSGSPAVMLSANRGNIAAYWCFFNHVTTFLIQPRQTGKSVSIDELMVMLLDIRCTNTQINLLTKDTGLRTKNIERLKKVFAEIPQYLNQRSKKDMDNTEQISIKALENTYVTHVPQGNERDAEKVGRGLTSPIFHIDEPAFQKFIKISLGAALAAGGAARGIAQAAGEPYGTILTTTAGKKDDRDGKYVYGLLSDAAEWTEKFFDCDNQEHLEKVIRGASRKGVVRINITFNHRQLGYTDEWMREQLEASMLEGEAADRDHFNRWTSGSQSSPLSAKQTQIIRDSQESDKYVEIHKQNSYVTRWYIEEDQIDARMSQGHYILASDTSEAGGGDDISVVVLDIRTGEVIVTGTYNDTNLLTFAEWLFGLFVRFQNLTGIIERKSTGGMIIDVLIRLFLARGIDPFRRLFNFAVQDAEEFPERFQEISLPMGRRPNDITTRHKKTFGFGTSSGGVTSRTELYSTTLRLAAEKGGSKVKDKTTIDQITSLEIRNGRVDHPSGEHDDMVIGWLLCWWLISNGKNLHFYGINSKDILSLAAPPQEMTQQDYRKHHEQQEVRRKIEELYAKIASEQDEYIASRLENELRMINRKLVLEDGEIFSVDELINSLRETKRRNKSNRLLSQGRGLYDDYNKQRVATTNKQVEYVNGVRTVTRY